MYNNAERFRVFFSPLNVPCNKYSHIAKLSQWQRNSSLANNDNEKRTTKKKKAARKVSNLINVIVCETYSILNDHSLSSLRMIAPDNNVDCVRQRDPRMET